MHLSAEINFISIKPGSDETRVMYTRSDNEEFMSGDDINEILNYFLNHFYKDLKKTYKIRSEDRNLNLMELIFSIIVLIKRAYIEVVLI